MILYHNDVAVCAQKVRIGLAEKGLEYDSRNLDLRAGEAHDPDYLRLNPNGVVPTLVDGDIIVTESTIINEYLEDAYPDHQLRPSLAAERARMRRWVLMTDTGFLRLCGRVSFAVAFRHQEQSRQLASRSPAERIAQEERNSLGLDHPEAREALVAYVRNLDRMALQLRQTPWLAGSSYSLAECALVPYVRRFENLSLSWLWEDYEERRAIVEWYAACRARPSFAAAIEVWTPPSKLDLMRSKGEEARDQVRSILGV